MIYAFHYGFKQKRNSEITFLDKPKKIFKQIFVYYVRSY